jgi:hypothetical protein
MLEASENKTDFYSACSEWHICNNYQEKTDCICGQVGIVNVFEIKNKNNKRVLSPIGCECIKKFKDERMTSEMNQLNNGNKIFKNKGGSFDGKT